MKGNIDKSNQSKIRKLGMTKHTVNTAIRPPDTEEIFRIRITNEGLTPRLHRGLLHINKRTIREPARDGNRTSQQSRESPGGHVTTGTKVTCGVLKDMGHTRGPWGNAPGQAVVRAAPLHTHRRTQTHVCGEKRGELRRTAAEFPPWGKQCLKAELQLSHRDS